MPQSPPDLMRDALGPSPELDRRNLELPSGLVVLFLVLFAGTFAVGLAALKL